MTINAFYNLNTVDPNLFLSVDPFLILKTGRMSHPSALAEQYGGRGRL